MSRKSQRRQLLNHFGVIETDFGAHLAVGLSGQGPAPHLLDELLSSLPKVLVLAGARFVIGHGSSPRMSLVNRKLVLLKPARANGAWSRVPVMGRNTI